MNKRNIQRGEIYWIDTNPHRELGEHVQRAGRPGIIVSSNSLNDKVPTAEIVFLTTRPKVESPTHCTIRSAEKMSTALCEQIQTISLEQIGNYIGTCSDNEMNIVDACLAISLELEPGTMASPQEKTERREGEGMERLYLKALKSKAEAYETMYKNLLEEYVTYVVSQNKREEE